MTKAAPSKPDPYSRWWLIMAAIGLATLALISFIPPAGKTSSSPPTTPGTNSTPLPVEDPASAAFHKVEGRWLRPDGGYVLDLRWVSPDGRVEAAYFNPRPIYVSRAEATQKDNGIEVMVELQDQNYPGCTYTLLYNAETDTLTGRYYQAALRETFEVYFERSP